MIEKPYLSNDEHQRLMWLAQNLGLVGITPENNDKLAEELYKYAGEGAVASYMQLEIEYPENE